MIINVINELYEKRWNDEMIKSNSDQNQGKIEGKLPKSQERHHNNPIYNNTWLHKHSMLNHLYPLFYH